jgi:hypothetical protein
VDRKLLSIYLNDHLAGSTAGIELVKRARGENEGSELGSFLEKLAKEIEADRTRLGGFMDDLGIRKDPLKVAAGWGLEKAGRLKLNGQLKGYSPLSRLVELEGLALGVTGKLALWKALRLVAETQTVLDADELDRLVERAEQQQRELEEHRLVAARTALGAEPTGAGAEPGDAGAEPSDAGAEPTRG